MEISSLASTVSLSSCDEASEELLLLFFPTLETRELLVEEAKTLSLLTVVVNVLFRTILDGGEFPDRLNASKAHWADSAQSLSPCGSSPRMLENPSGPSYLAA